MQVDVSQWKVVVVPRDMSKPFKLSLIYENFCYAGFKLYPTRYLCGCFDGHTLTETSFVLQLIIRYKTSSFKLSCYTPRCALCM